MSNANQVVDVQEETETQTLNPNLSYVYQELTKNDNGKYTMVSMVAYIIYKERKIEFFQTHNGAPTDEQLKAFHNISMMPSSIQGYRDQAESVVKSLLNLSLDRKIVEIETKFKTVTEANMTSSMEKLNNSVNAKHVIVNGKFDSIEKSVDTKYTLLDSKIDKFVNRGFWGWMFEVGRAVVITFFSTMILWFVLYAVKGKDVQSDIERKTLPTVSLPGQTEPQPSN